MGLSHRARAFDSQAAAGDDALQCQAADLRPCVKRHAVRRLRALAVLPVEVPVLRLQQPRAPRRRSTKRASCAPSTREIAATAARAPGRTVSSIFFGGGTPSLMQPQTVGAILDAIGKHWSVAPRCRSHARSQSDQRRGDALSRLSRGRRQSRLARRAGARRCVAESTRPPAHRAGSARRRRRSRASIFERYSFDLIYARPRPDRRRPGATNCKRAISRSRRASLALSADHRAGARRSSACTRPAS